MRHMTAHSCIALVALSAFLSEPGTATGQAGSSALTYSTRYGHADDPTAPANALFSQRETEVEQLVPLYGYPAFRSGAWSFLDLHSPWIKSTGIVFCRPLTIDDEPSSFVIVIPPRPEPIGFVPLSHGMSKAPDIEIDPHNIATFNSIVARERPRLVEDADRLELAAVFFHLFDSAPRLLPNPAGIQRGAEGGAAESQARWRTVVVNPDRTFTVRLERRRSGGSDVFELVFDKDGMLTSVHQTAGRGKGRLSSHSQ